MMSLEVHDSIHDAQRILCSTLSRSSKTCRTLLQALKQSSDLHTALEDEVQLTTLVASRPDIRRDCIELVVWYQFYQLAG